MKNVKRNDIVMCIKDTLFLEKGKIYRVLKNNDLIMQVEEINDDPEKRPCYWVSKDYFKKALDKPLYALCNQTFGSHYTKNKIYKVTGLRFEEFYSKSQVAVEIIDNNMQNWDAHLHRFELLTEKEFKELEIKKLDYVKCVENNDVFDIKEGNIYKVYEVAGNHIRISDEGQLWLLKSRFIKATDEEVKEFINKHRAKEVVLGFNLLGNIVESVNEVMNEIYEDIIKDLTSENDDKIQEVNIKYIPNESGRPKYEVSISKNLVGKPEAIERILKVVLHDLRYERSK